MYKGRKVLYKILIYATLIISIVGVAYFYYNSTTQKIEQLIAQNAQLEIVAASSEATLESLETTIIQNSERYSRLQIEFTEIRRQNAELRQRLSEHDLEALATAKPALIENTINSATQDALRCFELQSGAPLTEAELNAKNAKDFNSECPWLWTR